MSLEIINSTAYTVEGAYRAHFDDDVGVCTLATDYYIVQLDGTAHRRGGQLGGTLIPEIGTRRAWWLQSVYSSPLGKYTQYTIIPADIATGGRSVDANFDANLVDRVVPAYIFESFENYIEMKPIAILPDRILLAIENSSTYEHTFQGTAQYRSLFWIGSIPRSSTAPQTITLEHQFALDSDDFLVSVHNSVHACQSETANCIWIGGYLRESEHTDTDGTEQFNLIKYDYVNRRVVLDSSSSVGSLPYPLGKAPIGISWSNRFRRLVIVSTDTVYLLHESIAPARVLEPEVRYPAYFLEVDSISTTNPAMVKVRTPISQWAGGLASGDRVFITDDSIFSGYTLRFPSATYNALYNYSLSVGISNRTWECTIVDDYTLSIPRDGAAAVSYYGCTLDLVGGEGYQYLPYNTEATPQIGNDYGLYEGLQVTFGGFPPVGHVLNGVSSEIVSERSWHKFMTDDYYQYYRERQNVYFSLDRTGWGAYETYWPTSIDGYFRPRTDVGPIKAVNCTVRRAYETARVIAFDFREANPIYTVDNPDWLDVLGVTSTTQIQIRGDGIGYTEEWGADIAVYEAAATRVAADKFKYHLLDSSLVALMAASGYSTLTNEVQAVIGITSGYTLPLSVGDIVRVSAISSGDASVIGAVLTIIEEISPGVSYRTDLDTTGYGSWGIVTFMFEYATNIKGWGLATALDFTERYNSDAKEVRTRVLGTRDEPCSGRAVSWSATAGTFKQSVTETDEDGYAYAIYYPPAGAAGDYTITASVDTL